MKFSGSLSVESAALAQPDTQPIGRKLRRCDARDNSHTFPGGFRLQQKAKSLGLTVMPFLWAGMVRAQEIDDNTRSPVSLRPFQIFLPRDHLFGDWHGVRTNLDEQGFVPTLSFVTDIAGNPVGGIRQGVTHADNLGLDLLFDLNKLAGLKGASFVVSMSQRSGSSLSREYVGNVFTIQQVYGGQTFPLGPASQGEANRTHLYHEWRLQRRSIDPRYRPQWHGFFDERTCVCHQ